MLFTSGLTKAIRQEEGFGQLFQVMRADKKRARELDEPEKESVFHLIISVGRSKVLKRTTIGDWINQDCWTSTITLYLVNWGEDHLSKTFSIMSSYFFSFQVNYFKRQQLTNLKDFPSQVLRFWVTPSPCMPSIIVSLKNQNVSFPPLHWLLHHRIHFKRIEEAKRMTDCWLIIREYITTFSLGHRRQGEKAPIAPFLSLIFIHNTFSAADFFDVFSFSISKNSSMQRSNFCCSSNEPENVISRN